MSAAQLAFFNPYSTGASPPLQMFHGGGGPLPAHSCGDGATKNTDPRFGLTACPCDPTVNSPHRSSHLHDASTPKQACSPPAASLSPESSAVYPVAMALPHGLPQGLPESYKCLPTQLGWNGYDPVMSPYMYHPYNINGFDPNSAVRRKNATRETTSALKAWLYEHRKNPYPTKAEKIMLAIITRMTLTQVSTWFANARRRLKKENKFWNSNDKDSFLPDDDKEDENESFDSDTKDVSSARVISSLEKEHGRMRKLSGSCSDESYPETSDISDVEYNGDEDEKLIIVDDNVHDNDFSFSSSVLSGKSFSEEPKHHSSPNNSSSSHCHKLLNQNNVSCSQRTSEIVSHNKLNSDSASQSNHSASPSSSSRNNNSAPKPKIWSIANIIGDSKNNTSDSESPASSGSSSS